MASGVWDARERVALEARLTALPAELRYTGVAQGEVPRQGLEAGARFRLGEEWVDQPGVRLGFDIPLRLGLWRVAHGGPILFTANGGQERGDSFEPTVHPGFAVGLVHDRWTLRSEVGLTVGLTSPFPLTTFELGGGIRF